MIYGINHGHLGSKFLLKKSLMIIIVHVFLCVYMYKSSPGQELGSRMLWHVHP